MCALALNLVDLTFDLLVSQLTAVLTVLAIRTRAVLTGRIRSLLTVKRALFKRTVLSVLSVLSVLRIAAVAELAGTVVAVLSVLRIAAVRAVVPTERAVAIIARALTVVGTVIACARVAAFGTCRRILCAVARTAADFPALWLRSFRPVLLPAFLLLFRPALFPALLQP